MAFIVTDANKTFIEAFKNNLDSLKPLDARIVYNEVKAPIYTLDIYLKGGFDYGGTTISCRINRMFSMSPAREVEVKSTFEGRKIQVVYSNIGKYDMFSDTGFEEHLKGKIDTDGGLFLELLINNVKGLGEKNNKIFQYHSEHFEDALKGISF